MTNQEAYKALSEANVHWDRKDASHIVVWTSGYKTEGMFEIEKFLMQAGMVCLSQDFDKQSGKTMSTFKHK